VSIFVDHTVSRAHLVIVAVFFDLNISQARAAEHVPNLGGAGQGRNDLGLLYLKGLGVPKDYVQAYMWFSVAGVESNVAAAQEEMNPEQILKARQLAEEWKKQHPDPAIY
jgi:hypothetical protein